MKIFTTKLLGLVISALLLGACSQMATYENEDLTNTLAKSDQSGFKLSPYETSRFENAYLVDQFFTYSTETNTICFDESGEFIVSFYAQNPLIECGNFQIQYKLVGAVDWINLDETSPVDGVVTASLIGLPIGEYTFRAQWIRTGSQASCPNTLGSNTGWQVATDNLFVVNCVECEVVTDTGYVGDLEGENSGLPGQGFNNAWWYAFDTEGELTQNIYQKDNVIGTATYDEIDGTISIHLDPAYSLVEGSSESVKWYSYPDGSLPTAGRPTPGQAPNKGSDLVIDTNADRYYVIHLDVQYCSSEE